LELVVEEKKQEIIEGEFEVFPGITDEELREIYYFEPNVVGELPVKKAEETIKIGAIYPLTGSLATTGTDIKNGIMLAVDVINHEYDLNLPLAKSKGIGSLKGAKIEIVFGDSQSSPSTGKSEAERIFDEEKVVALIGCYQSAVTAEASQVAEDKGIPFLAPESVAPSLTQRGFKWFFRTTPDDKNLIQSFYEFLQDIQEEKGIKVEKLGIVYENSIWGAEFAEYQEQYAGEYGYQVVESLSYSSDTTNVTREVQRLKDAHPDVVMQASYINDAILYMRTYKEMNFNPDAFLADDAGFIEPEFLQTLGEEGNYILTRQTWSRDLAEVKPLVGIVNQMFRERYGTNMTGNSARAFTGMLVLADAINRADSTDPEAVQEALLETNIPGDRLIMPWDGVGFDHETHQNTLGKGIICQIIDQEYHTVWPWNLATKELIWPMPKWEEREQVR
jgi:branched-chain amino acid transport system substrate-binding protein